MEYVECPQTYEGNLKSVFVAGGITGCSSWQREYIALLEPLNIAVFNPRRESFPIDNPEAAEEQIMWEYTHLRKAHAISFWFCPETLNPIVLFELGFWMNSHKPIFIGADPDYKRVRDVKIQSFLARPDLIMVTSLSKLAAQVHQHFQNA